MITESDVIAIRRAFQIAGKEGALVELRRRLMHVSEAMAPKVLVKVLRLPVAPPAEYRLQDMRHKPGLIEM